jgi:hypothetical protein
MHHFSNAHTHQILISVPFGLDPPETFKTKVEDTFYPLANQYLPYALAITAIMVLIRKI